MARPTRPNIPGAIYHAMARGNERRQIYVDDLDRERFLGLLATTAHRCEWQILAYCLMGNHYHLVVETPRPTLSRGMRLLNGGYASYVNNRHERVGHLFQGRYRSVVVRSAEHLRLVMRYVLRNPVAGGLTLDPAGWPWSSYRATVAEEPNPCLAVRAALAWFGGDGGSFAKFISDEPGDPFGPTHDHGFEFQTEPVLSSESRPPVEVTLAAYPDSAGIARAYRDGYSLAEVAAAAGRSRSVIGRRLVAYESAQMLDSAS